MGNFQGPWDAAGMGEDRRRSVSHTAGRCWMFSCWLMQVMVFNVVFYEEMVVDFGKEGK